jgi:hypothetical protein
VPQAAGALSHSREVQQSRKKAPSFRKTKQNFCGFEYIVETGDSGSSVLAYGRVYGALPGKTSGKYFLPGEKEKIAIHTNQD